MYAGSASKPPTDEAIQLFEQKTGIKIEVNYGGSGKVLSQMKLAKEGDLYFPGSSDYMEKAKKDGDVIASTEARIAYLVPAINVQKGNPKNIQTLTGSDQARDKARHRQPRDPSAWVSTRWRSSRTDMSAAEKAAFKANLLNYTDSCEKTATAISLKQVDAVIGWSVFQYWDPDDHPDHRPPAAQIPRVGYIPIAVASYTKKQAAAQQFIDFLRARKAKPSSPSTATSPLREQAFAYMGEEKPVGGEYTLPADWVTK